MEHLDQIIQILAVSTDNAARKQAEETYNTLEAQNTPAMAAGLADGAVRFAADPASQNMCLVLLRKFFSKKKTAFDVYPEEMQIAIKSNLLGLFQTAAQPPLIRRAVGACIASLAVMLAQCGHQRGWPELWSYVLASIQDENMDVGIRANCAYIFSQAATCLTTTYFKDHLATLAAAFTNCLTPSSKSDVLVNTAEAVDNMVTVLSKTTDIATMSTVLPNYIMAVQYCCANNDEDTAQKMLINLNHLADCSPNFFKGKSKQVLDACMVIASNMDLMDKTRHNALEVVLEYGKNRPKMIKKDFAINFFHLMFSYLQSPPADEDWASTYDDSEEAGDSDFEVGATSMDRLARIVSHSSDLRDAMQAVAGQTIVQHSSSEDWRARVACLTSLTYLFEGCKEAFSPNLQNIYENMVAPRCNDEHPYVRFCAIQCIAQMCRDFSEENFQEIFAGLVLPLVCQKLADPVPRVQALAAATINTYLQDLDDEEEEDEKEVEHMKECEHEWFRPMVAPLVQALTSCLTSAPMPFIQDQVLLTLSTLITVAQKEIAPHVDVLVPLVQGVLTNVDDSSEALKKLKCRAIEVVTLIASVVGKDHFANYSHGICEYLNKTLASGLTNDDPRLRYLLRGWTCMVECMKEATLPYIAHVIPRLIEIASIQCDVEEIENEIGDEQAKGDQNVKIVRICNPGVGETTVRLHTGLIEDKDLAITILVSFIDTLKGHMAPYLRNLTELCCTLLDFQAYAEIRTTAASGLGSIAVAYKEAAPHEMMHFCTYVLPQLLAAAKKDTDVDPVTAMLESFCSILDCGEPDMVSKLTAADGSSLFEQICSTIMVIFNESLSRLEAVVEEQATREKNPKKQVDDDDEEEDDDLEDQVEEEEWMLSTLTDCFGKLIKTTPSFHALFVSQVIPATKALMGADRKPATQKYALCLLADFTEHAGASTVQGFETLTAAFGHFAASAHPEVKQAALYGGGELCKRLREFAAEFQESTQFVDNFTKVVGNFLVSKPKCEKGEWLSVQANAVSALLKAYEAFPETVNADALCTVVLPHVPVEDDAEEAELVHATLVNWALTPGHPVFARPHTREQFVARMKAMSPYQAATYLTDETHEKLKSM